MNQATQPTSSVGGVSAADGSKFKLLAELGRGGMATVYLAVVRGPAGFNKLIVVKCLRPSLAAEPEFLEMFLAEARLAARINHPNVVQTNEVGFDDKGQFYYIQMEYVEGPSLETIVRKAGENFPINIHLHVIAQALHGLHHAHELKDYEGNPLNVVHRDVSPHNIMVSYDGHVKLLDFGIAKAADSSGNTRTGILKGKCAYMAAEQFGGHDVDRRADIFAAGVILWQAITHRKLWLGLSDAEIFSHLSRGDVPSPLTVRPDLPKGLVDITMKALQLRREDRFSTAADFAGALEDFMKHNPAFAATSRELTGYVGELFGAERQKMRVAVEEQLRQVAASGASLVSFQGDRPQGFGPATGAPGVVQARPMRKGIVFGLVAIALAGLGAAGYVAKKRAATAVTQGADLVGAAQARVTVKVVPDDAKIFFDDAPLQGNPATATFIRDGLAHRVRAEAAAHTRKTELVVLDSSSVSVELELDAENKDDEVDPFGNKLTALTFKALPANARLYIDNVLMPSNPTFAKYPRDGQAHALRADAPGFLAKSESVNFDIARVPVTLTLEREAAAAAVGGRRPSGVGGRTPAAAGTAAAAAHDTPAAAAAPAAAPAAPAPAPAATGGAPGQKVLDRSDPWK